MIPLFSAARRDGSRAIWAHPNLLISFSGWEGELDMIVPICFDNHQRKTVDKAVERI